MFRSASRPFFSLYSAKSACSSRYFHRVTSDFIHYDARGNLVTRKVPCIIGNPGESYVLIDPEVGSALRAASPFASAFAASAEERCKLTFFHDSHYFGVGKCTCERGVTGFNKHIFNARNFKLSPPLYPEPNSSTNKFGYKPCNFILEWKDARDSIGWN